MNRIRKLLKAMRNNSVTPEEVIIALEEHVSIGGDVDLSEYDFIHLMCNVEQQYRIAYER